MHRVHKRALKHRMQSQFNMCDVHKKRDSKASNGSLLTIFQAAFSLPIAFSASVEGSVIEIKPRYSISGGYHGKPKSLVSS